MDFVLIQWNGGILRNSLHFEEEKKARRGKQKKERRTKMWSLRVSWSVYIFIGFISFAADGVILRNFRNNTLIESTKQPPAAAGLSTTHNANNNLTSAPSTAATNSGATNGSSATSQVVKTSRYIPSEQSCCAIGQRVARKNMPCDITNLAVLRKWHNYTNPPSRKLRSKRKIKLSEKISVCSAIFPKDFVLCCKHRDYFKQKKKCQKKPKPQKEKCKKMIRKRFS